MERNRGVTLAEIVVAIGLLAVASITLIGLFSKLLSTGGKSVHHAVATRLADRVLTRALREGPPNWGTGGTMNGVARLQTHRASVATEFEYRVTVSPPHEVRDGRAQQGALYEVEVEVSWWTQATDGNKGRRGQGQLSVTVERLHYVER